MKLNVKQIFYVFTILLLAVAVIFTRPTLNIQTDITSLITPATESQWPISRLTTNFSSIANVIIRSKSNITAKQTAGKILSDIQRTGMQVNVQASFSLKQIVSEIQSHNGNLLSDQYRKLIKNDDTKTIAQNTIDTVSTSISPTLVPISQDPFLLLTNYLSSFGTQSTKWVPQGDFLWQYRAPYHYILIPIEMPSATDSVFLSTAKSLERIANTLSTDKVQVFTAGAPMHTAKMMSHSKLELSILSMLATIAAIIISFLLFRRFFILLPILFSLLIGFTTGAIILFLLFSTPHILTFVFGTTLIGLGIDYSFHSIHSATNDGQKNSVRKNTFHSFLTTTLCFLPLLFSSISLLQQISVFTISGITAIYLGMLSFIPQHVKVSRRAGRMISTPSNKVRNYALALLCTIIAIAVPFTKIENNMSQLYKPTKELLHNDKLFSELSGGASTSFLIVRAPDIQKLLETEEEIKSEIDFFSISTIIPSLNRQTENQNLIKKLYKEQAKHIKTALGLHKIPKFIETQPLMLESVKSDFLASWLDKLLIQDDGMFYSVSPVSFNATLDHPNAQVFNPSDMITQNMSVYINETYTLLTVCTIALALLLLILYGGKGFLYLIPSALGIGLTITILTMFSQPITFFHLLSFFIVIGLSLDYTIFHLNSDSATEIRPVFYSFLSSFIGFGLLSFTTFFLIRSMGITLGLGLGLSYLISFYFFRATNKN